MLEWESHFISSHLHSHRHILSILSIKQSQWFHIKHVKSSENNIGKCEMALYLIECELQDIFLPASHLPNTQFSIINSVHIYVITYLILKTIKLNKLNNRQNSSIDIIYDYGNKP